MTWKMDDENGIGRKGRVKNFKWGQFATRDILDAPLARGRLYEPMAAKKVSKLVLLLHKCQVNSSFINVAEIIKNGSSVLAVPHSTSLQNSTAGGERK